MEHVIGIILICIIYIIVTWNGGQGRRGVTKKTKPKKSTFYVDIPQEPIAEIGVTKEHEHEREHKHETLKHLLLYGHAGTGKSTFCELIYAKLCDKYQREVNFHQKIAGQLRTPQAIEDLVTKIEYGDIVFIDETASLTLKVEEILYSVLQDFVYYPIKDSLTIDEYSIRLENEGKSSAIKIPPCTFLGATTNAGSISTPLRDRFPLNVELEKQSVDNLTEIVSKFNAVKASKSFEDYTGQEHARRLVEMHIKSLDQKPDKITQEASRLLASASLGIPRLANNFRYHASARSGELNKSTIDVEDGRYTLDILRVDENGLTPLDRRLIYFLLHRDNQAVGVAALAAVCGCSASDIKEMVVPRMVYANMLSRNNRSMLILTNQALEFYKNKEAAYDNSHIGTKSN